MQPVVPVNADLHASLAERELPAGQLLIGGEWSDGRTGQVIEHVNPATGRVQGHVPQADVTDVDEAVEAAARAFGTWRRLAPQARRDLLADFAAQLRARSEEFTNVLALESGLPVSVTSGFARRAAEFMTYYAGLVDKIEGQVINADPEKGFDYVVHEPYGVIGLIMTWNGGPSALARKAGAALAAGNTLVIKSSEAAPFSSVLFGRIAQDVGLPPGVVNVISGYAEAGDRLVRHDLVRKVSFTGGTGTARRIQEAAAAGPKPVAFELGGKSANIVFADADLEKAVTSAVLGATHMSGQGCTLPTRLLVEQSVYEEVLEDLGAHIDQVVIGDPLDRTVRMGPIVTKRQCDRILAMMNEARQGSGGSVLRGGERLTAEALAQGYFFPASVLRDVDPGSRIAQEEVFGPILVALPFKDEDDAVRIANGTKYGLAAYLHTSSLSRAHRLADALEAGNVRVNGLGTDSVAVPFGGVKESGFGREGGRAGAEEFLVQKNVFMHIF
jgi:aldehyde dehydrogenase (NAD+)